MRTQACTRCQTNMSTTAELCCKLRKPALIIIEKASKMLSPIGSKMPKLVRRGSLASIMNCILGKCGTDGHLWNGNWALLQRNQVRMEELSNMLFMQSICGLRHIIILQIWEEVSQATLQSLFRPRVDDKAICCAWNCNPRSL